MLKYAFIINVPGQNPDTYKGVYENSESYNVITATDNMDMAKDFVGKLAADGFTLLNLCGDFDDAITAELCEIAGPDVKIRHADYLPEQGEMVEALPEFSKFGIVIVMRGVEEPTEVVVDAPELYTKAIFVKDQEQANAAAKQLSDEGMHDIELCSWFDRERTQSVIDAVGGATPVGTCGEL
jgi:hypothetical protein